MASKKLINKSEFDIRVSLYVRSNSKVGKDAGENTVSLKPKETLDVSFGTTNDRVLNGVGLVAFHQGEMLAAAEVFVMREQNELDTLLNGNDALAIVVEDCILKIKPG